MVISSAITFLCFLAIAAESRECGKTPIDPNEVGIIGGNPARPFSWPWQIALVTNGMLGLLQCGGSILSETWILTAAHCVHKLKNSPSTFKVRAGVYNRKDRKVGQQRQIKQIIIHPKFQAHNFTDDVALLQLKKALVFNNELQPICIPKKGRLPKKDITITGWGRTKSGLSDVLRQVTVPLIDEDLCEAEYERANLSLDPISMFCAAAPGEDSCSGDSGGPAVMKVGDRWFQKGIVSWGKGCARDHFPGVYSRVSAYCDFILDHTKVQCS